MQTQRMILWIVFSMSLLFLWDAWQKHNGQPSMFGGPVATQQTGAAGNDGQVADASIPPAPVTSVPGGAAPGSTETPAAGGASSTQPIRLANDVLALEIDPMGGMVRRAELLEHRDLIARDGSPFVLLRSDAAGTYLAQSGLIGAPEGQSFPTHRTMLTPTDAGSGPRELRAGDDAVTLTLVGESGGLRLTRTYTLARGAYVIDVKDEITNLGDAPVQPTLYMQLTRDAEAPSGGSSFYSTYHGPVIYTDADKFQKVGFDDIGKGKARHSTTANDGWAGMIEHYFVSAWVPDADVAREYYTRKVGEDLYSVGIRQGLPAIAAGATTTAHSRLLIGPQDQRMLESVAPGLDLTVDYGWLKVIAKPIHWLLEFLHGIVGNWGWSIVLLTIIIKTLFFPLQAASYKSMARMKAVTPRMQQIRERYGDDRAKMNQAMMELYKTEKINPLGGCLPIVVQIPVFIALYWVLLASVEMRDAPWFGWIKDLSAPDPFYILPLVMAGTMFIQVKLNPTPPDPMQAKMMMIMPLVFSVMFFFFPAGLVLYWLVNNVYSIIQQYVITRKIQQATVAARIKG
ncbi:MAG: membrane protein insertase YidC [Burkholderiaceae bacterium]